MNEAGSSAAAETASTMRQEIAKNLADFAFPEVVRLLQKPGAARIPGTIGPLAEEAILFRAASSLGFPAGDLARLLTEPADTAGWDQCLEVNFLGLYGPASPLPTFWSEHIIMEGPGASSLRDFLDAFNHPLIALAYRVWRHYRLELDVGEDATDRCSSAALAMAGWAYDPLHPGVLDPIRLLPLCGLLAQHARSAAVLTSIVSRYFDVDAAVEEFVPRRVEIPPGERFVLGTTLATLGFGTVLGERVPEVSGAITLTLGPLSAEQFAAFLPGGTLRPALGALVQTHAGENA